MPFLYQHRHPKERQIIFLPLPRPCTFAPLRRFRRPEGVAVDHDGYVYVADAGNHAIRSISPSGRVRTIAGTGSPGSEDGPAGGADGARFSSPADVAVWRDWAWWPVSCVYSSAGEGAARPLLGVCVAIVVGA